MGKNCHIGSYSAHLGIPYLTSYQTRHGGGMIQYQSRLTNQTTETDKLLEGQRVSRTLGLVTLHLLLVCTQEARVFEYYGVMKMDC